MLKAEWLCWNCERWNIGRLKVLDDKPLAVREGMPKTLKGFCINCGEASEILVLVSSGKPDEE